MMTEMTTTSNAQDFPVLILVAAGSSSRIGFDKDGKKIKKEYLPLRDGTVLSTAARAFVSTLQFKIVAVTYPFSENPEELKQNEEKCREALFSDSSVKNSGCKFLFVPGGKTRQASVYEALEKISDELDDNADPICFIHDGARPFVSQETISLTYTAAKEFGAAAPGLRPIDTQKEIDANGFIKRHLERTNLIAIQTPQAFRFEGILEAHRQAESLSQEFTDDTEIWDKYATKLKNQEGSSFSKVKVIIGDPDNKKITYQGDLDFLK